MRASRIRARQSEDDEMKAIERLKRDHHLLRGKLNLLDTSLRMGPETWFVLREICRTLSQQLRDHMRREEKLVAGCRALLDADMVKRLAVEHLDEPQHLRAINRLFLNTRGRSLEEITPALRALIDGLRHHMDDEEATLFPTLERVLAPQEAKTPMQTRVTAASMLLDDTMTVNAVLQLYPQTHAVFHRFFINARIDGCSCLDEVAWRHGLESQELLAYLQEAIEWAEAHDDAGSGAVTSAYG